MVEALLEAGADINFKGGNGDLTGLTPLIYATATGNEDIARYLISRGAKLNEVDDNGFSAAGAAIARNDVGMLKLLGDSGANLRQLQGSYKGPLIRDAARSVEAGAEMVQYLIRKGADVNQEDGEGDATLFHAGPFGNTRVADLLLRAGADIDNINNNENKKSSEKAQFLNKKGANLNLLVKDCNVIRTIGESYDERFKVDNVKSPSIPEVFGENYWLGKDFKNGEFVLECATSVSLDTIELVNTRSGNHRDRGTKEFQVELSESEDGPWKTVVGPFSLRDPRKENYNQLYTYFFTPVKAKFVKFKMLSYYGFGGGLNYFMASKEDVNQEDGEGDATLFHAGPFGNTRVADLLLRAGADIDNINNNENKKP